MKYVFFTFEGTGLPIAEHLLREGQEVLVGQVEDFTQTLTESEKKANLTETLEEKKLRLKRYKNILPKMPADKLLERLKKVKDPEEYFLFFDSNNLFYYAQQLQHLGFHGNFPVEEDREYEVNRDKAKEFVKKYYPKLKIAQKKTFFSIKEAVTFLENSDIVWVLKSQTDAIPTFVPETSDINLAKKQLIETLNVFRDGYEKSGFFLERKIENVIEVTPEKYYYDGKPLYMVINIENKFIGSGNLSVQVGCAGDLVFPTSMRSKIHDICFPSIIDKLAKKHKGFFIWDASVLIDSTTEDIYFGEFCPNRPGYNSIFTQISQVKNVHSFFEKIAKRENPLPLGTVGVSLMLFNILTDEDHQILGDTSIEIAEGSKAHSWPYDIYKKTVTDNIRTVGYDDHLSPITGSGKSLANAVDDLFQYVEGFAMTRVYYRPKFDFLSKDYATSIMNRLEYCLEKKLFTLPFSL